MSLKVNLNKIDVFNVKSGKLDPKVSKDIESILEFETVINDYLAHLSKNKASVASLLTNDLKEIGKISLGLPREFSIFSIFEHLQASGAHQFAQLVTELIDALEGNRLYSSVILLRAMFECTCYMSYPLDKSTPKTADAFRLMKETKGKGGSEKYDQVLLDVYKIATNAYYSVNTEIGTVNSAAKFYKFSESSGGKSSIHINDTIRSLEKLSKLPLLEHYDVLSEFSHPNYASRLLVIEETKPINEFLEGTQYGFNPNETNKIKFQTIFSEIILHVFQLFFASNQRYKKYLDLWYSLFEYAEMNR